MGSSGCTSEGTVAKPTSRAVWWPELLLIALVQVTASPHYTRDYRTMSDSARIGQIALKWQAKSSNRAQGGGHDLSGLSQQGLCATEGCRMTQNPFLGKQFCFGMQRRRYSQQPSPHQCSALEQCHSATAGSIWKKNMHSSWHLCAVLPTLHSHCGFQHCVLLLAEWKKHLLLCPEHQQAESWGTVTN